MSDETQLAPHLGKVFNGINVGVQTVRGGAARKTERLRDMVSEAGQCGELMSLQVPLPLDPTVLLNGIIPASCSVFKSAMAPIRLTFRVAGETCCPSADSAVMTIASGYDRS